MPIPLAIGAALIGNAMNAGSTAITNAQNRKFSEHMYDRQRSDALADFAMQNEYNSPAAQMERLKAAGLNPNLVYGDGANAASSTMRSSSVPSGQSEAPRFDFQSSILAAQDLEVKKAQTDNLKAATDVSRQQALNVAADTANKSVTTATNQFQLSQAEALKQITLDKAAADLAQTRVSIDKTKADITFTLNQDERNKLTNAQSLAKGMEEILTLRAQRATTDAQRQNLQQQTQNLIKDGSLKAFELQLRKNGISPNDPTYMRIITQMLDGDVKGNIESFLKKGWNGLKNTADKLNPFK